MAFSSERAMRIAQVTATFPPNYSGTGTFCYHTSRGLAERGHDVHVFTADWPGERDDPPGVTVHRIRNLVRLGDAPLLPQLATLSRFDLLHLHYPFVFGAEMVTLRSAIAHMPLVVSYHNDLLAPGLRGRLFSIYERTVTPEVLRAASRICVPSRDHAEASSAIREAIKEHPERLVPLPSGVDTSLFNPTVSGEPIRKRFRIPERATVAGFVGGLDTAHHFKRVDLLLRAVAQTHELRVQALIVGGGDLLGRLQRLACELHIDSHVHFAGQVAQQDLPPYIAAMDVVAMPADSGGSFGTALIEAMACGRPVIASDLPGVAGVVTPGVDGLLVPPGNVRALADAICAIKQMPAEQRRSMGDAGRARVEADYTWERTCDRVEALYFDVLKERVAGHAV